MRFNQLQNNLLMAYSIENLNRISIVLLNLYKNREFDSLQKIADVISDFVVIQIDKNGKGFSKLMMLYHPDRGAFHIDKINTLAADKNFDKLLEYSHILKLERIEEIASLLESMEDIDYSPIYAWDFESQGFSVKSDSENKQKPEKRNTRKTKFVNFYDAVKIRQYGHSKISFPPYYLEDIDEFELSDSGINDLDGIQFCIHAVDIDLSENRIVDLRPLENLAHLEMLNLSYNRIEIIDSLEYLTTLRELNLSNNRIRDIEPIFSLENLEYVDLTGNPLPERLIEKLRNRVKVVEFE